MRIGHCQVESKCGDFEGNLAKVVKGLEQAQRERVEVVCFPECFLTGYPDTELHPKEGFFDAVLQEHLLDVLAAQRLEFLDNLGCGHRGVLRRNEKNAPISVL